MPPSTTIVVHLVGASSASPWPGIVAGIVGALLGSTVTYIATGRQLRGAADEGAKDRENAITALNHQHKLDSEEALRRDRARVYVEVIRYANWVKCRADDQIVAPGVPPSAPAPVDLSVLEAEIVCSGSQFVSKELRNLDSARVAFDDQAEQIRNGAFQAGAQTVQAHQDRSLLLSRLDTALIALRKEVRHELGLPPDL